MKIKLIAALMSIAMFAGMFSTTAFAAVENDSNAQAAQDIFVKSIIKASENYLSDNTSESENDPSKEDPGFGGNSSDMPNIPGLPALFPDGFDTSLITKEFVSSLLVPTEASEKITAFAVKFSDSVYSVIQDSFKVDSAKTVDEYLKLSIDTQKSILAKYEELYSEVLKLTSQEQLDYAKILAENIYNKLEEIYYNIGDDDMTSPDLDGDIIDNDSDYDGDDFDYDEPLTPEEIKQQIYEVVYNVLFVEAITQHDDIVSGINDSITMFEKLQGTEGFAQSVQAFYVICQQLGKLSEETAYGYIVNAKDKFYDDHFNDGIIPTVGFDIEDLDSAPTPAQCVENYLRNINDETFELSLFVDKNYFRSEAQGECLRIIKENLGKISDEVKKEINGILSVTNIDKLAGSVDEYIAAYEKNGVTTLVYGDVTADEKVTAGDVLAIRKFVAGQKITFDTFAADVNTDGKITASDVLLIRKHIAGQNIVLGPEFSYDDDEPDVVIGE